MSVAVAAIQLKQTGFGASSALRLLGITVNQRPGAELGVSVFDVVIC